MFDAWMFLNDVSRRRNYWQTSVAIPKISRGPKPRSTTYKIPEGLDPSRRAASAAQRADAWEKYATHEEKYGWDPVEARREYKFSNPPGPKGLPRFKGYFG